MWNNLKKGLDSFIAEEQARQRAAQSTPTRATASASRLGRQATSAARGGVNSRSRTPDQRAGGEPAGKGPDPSEFEPEFVIGDEDGGSRSSTPANVPSRTATPNPGVNQAKDGSERGANEEVAADGKAESAPSDTSELPAEVRVKLRKLDRLEGRYQELLKSYRVAHARVSTIEIFEAALRENTPLTSINDPNAFTEYLNQVNHKSDMVLDELRKVTKDKTELQAKLEKSEQDAKEARSQVAALRETGASATPAGDEAKDESVSDKRSSVDTQREASKDKTGIKSPPLTGMLKTAGMSLFSPKAKPTELGEPPEEVEELFSYDNEVPRLENELEASQKQVVTLQKEVKDLNNDLTVARESTQSMVQTLEEATREANQLRDQNEELRASTSSEISNLRTELEEADGKLRRVQIELEQKTGTEISPEQKEQLLQGEQQLTKFKETEDKLKAAEAQKAELVTKLQKQESEATAAAAKNSKRSETTDKLIGDLRAQLKGRDDDIVKLKGELATSLEAAKSLQATVDNLQAAQKGEDNADDKTEPASSATAKTSDAAKKKGKKKKGKGGQTKAADTSTTEAEVTAPKEANEEASVLRQELSALKDQVTEKNAAIDRLHAKLKGEEDMREEIEGLKDDLINMGQEHVDAKERIKSLEAEKATLETQIADLEKEMAELRSSQVSSSSDEKKAHEDLTKQFEELKSKSASLQTDLAVANQLASSRFKDLQDMRSALQKAQPELTTLRKDNSELKTAKTDLQARVSELERIEARHSTVRAELTAARKTIGEKDLEINTLTKKVTGETTAKEREEQNRKKATRAQETAESEKRQVSLSLERTQKDLAKAREELATSRSRVSELEGTLSKVQRELDNLKEEIELKTAQHASAESLMSSMRDQTSEMATQSKETRERCENLEEEVAEAHRLLSERSREAETMRRMLNEIEGRTETRIREMKDRLDSAIEERDRVEDEASTTGRRRAREVEDLRGKLRDAERDLKRAESDKDELESASREWRRRRDELESRAESTDKESEEVRKAMAALRDALDESERQSRELEKQRMELQRSMDETQQRLERAQKSNKLMAEEVRSLQSKAKASPASHSPRPSVDATRPMGGPPAPANGQGAASSEAYLKNVLLQFLETREQKHRVQLIPVLGMLLHFDKRDEQRWMAAISTK